MHTPHSSHDHNTDSGSIKKNQLFTIVFPLIASVLLLCSCVDPYSSLYGESPEKIKEDLHFLEEYKDTMCGIKEKHEYEEISSGRCLALYYDYKDQSRIKVEMEAVVKRVRLILEDPGEADQSILDQLSKTSTEIVACKQYIPENCM